MHFVFRNEINKILTRYAFRSKGNDILKPSCSFSVVHSDFQMALHFFSMVMLYASLRKSFKDVLFTGATGLWMLLTAESYVLSSPLETGH